MTYVGCVSFCLSALMRGDLNESEHVFSPLNHNGLMSRIRIENNSMICWGPNMALFAINIESEWKDLVGIFIFPFCALHFAFWFFLIPSWFFCSWSQLDWCLDIDYLSAMVLPISCFAANCPAYIKLHADNRDVKGQTLVACRCEPENIR